MWLTPSIAGRDFIGFHIVMSSIVPAPNIRGDFVILPLFDLRRNECRENYLRNGHRLPPPEIN